jgi:hypothetical protein
VLQAKLPKYVAGKPYAWDADICVSFLDKALTWVETELSAARSGQRFRLEYCPKRCREIRLTRDRRIPPFLEPSPANAHSALYAVCSADDVEAGNAGGRVRDTSRDDIDHEPPPSKQPRMY